MKSVSTFLKLHSTTGLWRHSVKSRQCVHPCSVQPSLWCSSQVLLSQGHGAREALCRRGNHREQQRESEDSTSRRRDRHT